MKGKKKKIKKKKSKNCNCKRKFAKLINSKLFKSNKKNKKKNCQIKNRLSCGKMTIYNLWSKKMLQEKLSLGLFMKINNFCNSKFKIKIWKN